MRRRDQEVSGVALAATAAVFFGTLAILAKEAYRQGASPVPLLAVRFSTATVLLASFRAASRAPLSIGAARVARLLLLGALGYALESTLFFAALERAPASVVALVFYSYPLWTTLASIAMGLERFTAAIGFALLLGTAGVALIFSVTTTELIGPLLALAAAFAVTAYFVAAQIIVRDIEPSAAATWTAAGAALSLTAAALVTGQRIPAGALVAAGALGGVTAVAFVAMFGAIARVGSARVGIAMMLEPVTTVVLAAAFLGEVISGRVVLGAILVLSALPLLLSIGPSEQALERP